LYSTPDLIGINILPLPAEQYRGDREQAVTRDSPHRRDVEARAGMPARRDGGIGRTDAIMLLEGVRP